MKILLVSSIVTKNTLNGTNKMTEHLKQFESKIVLRQLFGTSFPKY